MAYDGEICQDCGLPVALGTGTYWDAPNELWSFVMGGDDPGGILCPRCFTLRCEKLGIHIYWACAVVKTDN